MDIIASIVVVGLGIASIAGAAFAFKFRGTRLGLFVGLSVSLAAATLAGALAYLIHG